MKFDHLGIPVSDWTAAREWYVNVLGLRVEFEISDRGVVALQDDHDFAVLFHQGAVPTDPAAFGFWFQVADVHQSFDEISRKGVHFNHPPQKAAWGYGAELSDPDGYRVYLWDQASMKANS